MNTYLRHIVRTGLHNFVHRVPVTPWQQAPSLSFPWLITSSMWMKKVTFPFESWKWNRFEKQNHFTGTRHKPVYIYILKNLMYVYLRKITDVW